MNHLRILKIFLFAFLTFLSLFIFVDASGIVVKKPKKSVAQKDKTKNTQTFSADTVISSQVIGLYIREGLIDAMNPDSATIHVTTKQGVVYLSGTVTSDASATTAVNLAQTISGVVKVQSSLKTVSP